MSSTKNATFTMNELVAISAALDSQIEYCQDFLSDPDFSMDEKAQSHKPFITARLLLLNWRPFSGIIISILKKSQTE